jgi:hypothetical protein
MIESVGGLCLLVAVPLQMTAVSEFVGCAFVFINCELAPVFPERRRVQSMGKDARLWPSMAVECRLHQVRRRNKTKQRPNSVLFAPMNQYSIGDAKNESQMRRNKFNLK